MRFLVIMTALCLLCLTAPVAYAEYDEEECSGNSCDAPPGNTGGAGGSGGSGGDGGDGGDGGAGGDGGDASASNFGIQKTYATGGDSESSSYSRGGSASNFGIQDQDQDNDVTINNPADDVEGAAKQIRKGMERSAPAAPRAESRSRVVETNPCGDSTGLSISTGPVAIGAGTITEACRVFRLNLLSDAKLGFSWGVLGTQIVHWAGFIPRLIVHVASGGILN